MINIYAWNVQGFNKPVKQHEVKELLKKHNPGICIILETKVKMKKVENIMRCLRDWSLIDSYNQQEKGIIWVLFNQELIQVHVIQKSDQIITCLYFLKEKNLEFLCSVVYAQNSQETKQSL